MKRPAVSSILLGSIPFVAACFSVPLWDRIHPMVFGLPFNFFWLISWMIATPICLWGALRIETRRELASQRNQDSAFRAESQGGAD